MDEKNNYSRKMKIEKVFEQELEQGESKTFLFHPQSSDKKVVGFLFSSGVDVSLSFYDNTDLIYHDQQILHTANIAPDKRVIRFEKLLYDKVVQGKVSFSSIDNNGVQANRKAIVHLMIDQI